MKLLPSRFVPLLHTLLLAVCIADVRADDKPTLPGQPDRSQAAVATRGDTRTFAVSELGEIRINAMAGSLSFQVGEATYTYKGGVSDCIAVLDEIRKYKKFTLGQLYVSSAGSKNYQIGEFIFSFSELK